MEETNNQPQAPLLENKEPKKELPPGKKIKVMAILAYVLFFIPLLTESKNDPFVKYHTRQGAIVFIILIIGWVLNIIPRIGWLVSVFGMVLAVIGIVHVVHQEQKPLPWVGKYSDKLEI